METSFKVGDAIVIPSRGNGIFYFNALFSESDIAEARHATPAEIAAGHRIESSNDQAISDCSFSDLNKNEKQSSLSIKQDELSGNSGELEVLDLTDVGPNTKVSEL